jgi:ferrous iron transport protein B
MLAHCATPVTEKTPSQRIASADPTIALAGNPNCGKSTLFNALTGAHQHVGNWPGKTVEKKEGSFQWDGALLHVVDLPGTYSLTAYSPEEIITRDFIITARPDAVIVVLDAANLERNLYLATQVLELGVPIAIALNMSDVAESRGIRIDAQRLSRLVGQVPVVRTVGTRNRGLDELVNVTLEAAQRGTPTFKVNYGQEIEEELEKLTGMINDRPEIAARFGPRWLALKLLESERDIVERVDQLPGGPGLVTAAGASIAHLEAVYGDDVDIIIADQRYGFVSGLARQVITHTRSDRLTLTDRIDQVVASRVLGIPIFLLMMYVVFRLIQDVSAPFLDWVDAVITGPLSRWSAALLTASGGPDWLKSLVLDGVIAGVGGVLAFLPGLMVLYFFLALLEDSGYMARAAFVMDRFMNVLGLHGKSFIPMILGFGCGVPGIYATRTLEDERDRILTGLLVPLMSCSARLPVYAVLTGVLLSRTLFPQSRDAAFVLELPPYRLPTLRGLLIHMWSRTSNFVRKAGTVILAVTVILWLLLNLPWGVDNQRDSLYGNVSAAVAPVFEPLGLGNWESAGALMSGFVAKEIVVSTLSQIHLGVHESEVAQSTSLGADVVEIGRGFGEAVLRSARSLVSIIPGVDLRKNQVEREDTALSTALRAHYSQLSAVAMVVFVLLYVPCAAALGAIRHEFGGKWALFSAVYQFGLAWVAALVVYQGGQLLGLG